MFLALLQWYSLVSSIFKLHSSFSFAQWELDKTVQNWPARLQNHSFCRINHCQMGGLPAFGMIFLMNCAANFSLQTIYT